MRRYELIEALIPELSEVLVLCNIGIPSQEMFSISDRENQFYMLGSMGLCSSIGLGLSLATKKTVVALEGDGSVLMNLGSLATIANRAPRNFILLVIDNGSYGSTGDQPTFTSEATSLAEIARGAGCKSVVECLGEATVEHLRTAMTANCASVIISKVEAGNENSPVVPLHPIVLRERFKKSIRA